MKKLFMPVAVGGLLLLAGCGCEEMCETKAASCKKPVAKVQRDKKAVAKPVAKAKPAKKMKKKKHHKAKAAVKAKQSEPAKVLPKKADVKQPAAQKAEPQKQAYNPAPRPAFHKELNEVEAWNID